MTQARHVQLAFAHHRDQHVERLFGDTVDLLDVQQRPVAQRCGQRTVDEHLGVVPLSQYARGVEVSDQTCRREFGIPLDEFESDTELFGHGAQQGRLAGARWTFEHDVAVGQQRRYDKFDFASASDDVGFDSIDELTHGADDDRSCADTEDQAPAPPASRQSKTSKPRTFLCASMSSKPWLTSSSG